MQLFALPCPVRQVRPSRARASELRRQLASPSQGVAWRLAEPGGSSRAPHEQQARRAAVSVTRSSRLGGSTMASGQAAQVLRELQSRAENKARGGGRASAAAPAPAARREAGRSRRAPALRRPASTATRATRSGRPCPTASSCASSAAACTAAWACTSALCGARPQGFAAARCACPAPARIGGGLTRRNPAQVRHHGLVVAAAAEDDAGWRKRRAQQVCRGACWRCAAASSG